GKKLVAEEATKPIEVFYSYAQEDDKYRKKLETHLSVLRRQKLINNWHPYMIGAGKEREREINAHLNAAHIILLLVSPDFINSDYCYDVEMTRAMERHKAGEARVIPILLRPVHWHGTSFGELQALPTNGKSVTGWPKADEAFYNIAEGIRNAVEEQRKKLLINNKSVSKAILHIPELKFDATKDYLYDIVFFYVLED